MAAQFILTVAIFQLAICTCYAVSGIIWHKQQQEFVQLFSIPQFAALQEENLAKRRAIEMQDMRGVVVKTVYYEEKNMVMFFKNDTAVYGIYGSVWNILANYLNFTFIPAKTTIYNFGEKLKNGSQTGLLGMLVRNETQVIMRSGFYPSNMDIIDYTMPLWKSRFHIYVQPEWLFDNKWIFTIYSWKMWFYTVFLFIVLSCSGYFLQKVPSDKPKRKREGSIDFSLRDHFFYSFAIMSSQGYVPDAFYNKFKILSLAKSIFAWLILIVFNSQLIYRMANRDLSLPFKDIGSLINNTNYVLLVFRGILLYNSINTKYRGLIGEPFARVRFIDSAEEMHSKICNDMKEYALFEMDDRFMALNRNGCPLEAIGNFNETWITFALQKNYRYKKTINSALIKFREVGLFDGIRDYYLSTKVDNVNQKMFKMIDFRQVLLIFLVLGYGMLISLVILVVENITYYINGTKNTRQYRRR